MGIVFFSIDLRSVEEGLSSVPLSALDTVALAAHYSFLLASVSKLPGRRPQVRVPGSKAESAFWSNETDEELVRRVNKAISL